MTDAEAHSTLKTDDRPPYRVLARKYRPATFAELVGQDALVRTLTNALRSGRLAQAYMLSGVRGVGKTTTARILARALNCVGADGKGGLTAEPCGVCEHCRAIADDRHLDVIEMDGATHTGKDEIRELLDGVRYRPTTGRYKVYIIDEVHMLSEKAFNALLKTLEEPPSHVRFVFATTEIRKVPVTVLSRCQRFDLRRVDSTRIAGHLADIAAREGADVSPQALQLIARAADGSIRDGLSLLDQALALAAGRAVDAEMVQEMLGLADRTQIYELLEALLAGDAGAALTQFSALYEAGADPLLLLEDLLEAVHWLTRIKITPAVVDSPDVAEAERVRGGRMAERLDVGEISRAWQILLKGLNEVRYAPQPLAAAEMALIRLCYAATLPTPAEALRRLSADAADTDPARAAATRPAAPLGPAAAKPAPPSRSPAASLAPAPPAPPAFDRRGSALPIAESPPTTPRAVPTTEASAPPPDDGKRPHPRCFEDIVEMLAEQREMILHGHILGNVRLVSFQRGRIALRLEEAAPPDLPQRLSRFLAEQTGERWLVSVSDAPGGATIAEQRNAASASRLARAAAHPLVKAVLATFPGARLDGVRTAGQVADVTVGDGGSADEGVVTSISVNGDSEGDAEGDSEDMADDSEDGNRD